METKQAKWPDLQRKYVIPGWETDLMNGCNEYVFENAHDMNQTLCGGQCQLGVLPLGTGNDLARVLGWGPSCDDDTQLPQILEKLERASTKMLDRYKAKTSTQF